MAKSCWPLPYDLPSALAPGVLAVEGECHLAMRCRLEGGHSPQLGVWGDSSPLSCSRFPPFTLVLNEPINHLRLLTVLITLTLETCGTIIYCLCLTSHQLRELQAACHFKPRQRQSNHAHSWLLKENSQKALPERRLHPTQVAKAMTAPRE